MVFVDESTINERTLDRCHGWVKKRTRSIVIQPFKHTEWWSLCLAYSTEGFLVHDTIHGSYTTTTFNAFISEKVLISHAACTWKEVDFDNRQCQNTLFGRTAQSM